MRQVTLPWLQGLFNKFLKNPLFRRVILNSGYLFSATGISAALSMFQSMLAGKLLGVAGFGILGTITTFTSVINRLLSFRMGELVIKYVGQYSQTGDNQRAAAVFKAAALAEMSASILAFGLVCLLAPWGARVFTESPALTGAFTLYGLIILANLISESSTGLLQIYDRFRPVAVLNVFQSALTLGIIAAVYLLGGDLTGVLVAYLSGKVFAAGGLSIMAFQEASRQWGSNWWRTPLGILRPQTRELAHFAVSTNLSGTLSLINKDSDLLWLQFFRPSSEVGLFKAALAVTNLVQLPVSPLPQATYPEISREVASKNWGNVRYILRQGSLIAGGFTIAATIVLTLFGRPVLQFLYSPEFLPAYPALLILLAGFLLANTFYWNRTALLALGRPDFPTKVNLLLALMKTAGILLLVPRFGHLASAALLAGSYLIGVTVSVFKANQIMSQQEQMINRGVEV
jgi:O-antigen/teichoic acid export membrane protein